MADTGFVFPGTAVGNRNTGGSEDFDWVNFNDIKADDSNDADSDGTEIDSDLSSGLAASNFDFSSIPAGSAIDGIEVEVGDYFVTGGTNWGWSLGRLILADDTNGSGSRHFDLTDWTGTAQTDQMGGASILWSETPSTADVQDVDWGVFVRVQAFDATNLGHVGYMKMKVYYTTSPVITDVDTDETWTDGDTGLVITGTNFV